MHAFRIIYRVSTGKMGTNYRVPVDATFSGYYVGYCCRESNSIGWTLRWLFEVFFWWKDERTMSVNIVVKCILWTMIFWSNVFVEGTVDIFRRVSYGRSDIVWLGYYFQAFFNFVLWKWSLFDRWLCLISREKGKYNMDILIIK